MKMVKQMKMMKQIKMIFIIIFSTALFGCGSMNNDMNISNLMGWGKNEDPVGDTSKFTSVPPNLIETDGLETTNPTEIKFVVTGTAVKNCDIQTNLPKAGTWGPVLTKGETTITGTTYSSDYSGRSNFLLFSNCSEDSTATVSVEYTVGTKKYSGTTPTNTILKT
jgi:hypothetical protein